MSLDSKAELGKIISTVSALLKHDGKDLLVQLLAESEISSEVTNYDNWDGGQTYYTIYIKAPVNFFATIQDQIEDLEKIIEEKIETANKANDHEHVSKVVIVPDGTKSINWGVIADLSTKEKLIQDLYYIKNALVSVSTGGQRIQEVNDQYQKTYKHANKALSRLNIPNPNPYSDLWLWYGKWNAEFPTYAERRTYLNSLFKELFDQINSSEDTQSFDIEIDLVGWSRIERTVAEIKRRVSEASTEEQYQGIGLLCREVIISLAQEVYDKDKHPPLDDVIPSETDAKRMIEAYISVELGGSAHENTRRLAKATLTLANELTHKRTATRKDALLCSSSTLTLINLIRIIEEN